MTCKLTILLFALAAIFSCKNADVKAKENVPTITATTDATGQDVVIDLAEVLKKMPKKTLTDVSIDYDHFYKKPKTFVGYDFRPLLDSAIKRANFDTTNALMVFECIDGYKPSMALWKAYAGNKSYVVFKDKDAKSGKNWLDSLETTFPPYYLTWQGVKLGDHSFSFPYGLTAIRLTPAVSELKNIYPSKNPEFVKGFTLFKENCNKCHAVNHIGGIMGPEFNIPKNITEYWTETDILNFSQNPQSYRISSVMPAMNETVSVEETKEIIGYLKFMASNKIYPKEN
jgi:mono/diheme cytochrome c family protein